MDETQTIEDVTNMISESLIVILSVIPNGNLNECPSEHSLPLYFAARKILNIHTHFRKIPIVSEYHFK